MSTTTVIKRSFTISGTVSLLGVPLVTVALLITYIFADTSTAFMFNTVNVAVDASSGAMTFDVGSGYLWLIAIVFGVTFALAVFVNILIKKNQQNRQ
jgi:hypothetical protein